MMGVSVDMHKPCPVKRLDDCWGLLPIEIVVIRRVPVSYTHLAKKQVAGTADENLPILSAAAPFKAGTRGDATYYTCLLYTSLTNV